MCIPLIVLDIWMSGFLQTAHLNILAQLSTCTCGSGLAGVAELWLMFLLFIDDMYMYLLWIHLSPSFFS